MGNAAGGMEVPLSKEGKAATLPTGSTGSQKPPAGLKLPMPPEDELEERFNAVLVSWWAGAGAGTLHSCHLSHRAGGYTTPKECRICRKCAPSSRSSLCCARYTKPLRTDTQRCFILRLTLALSTLHALLEVEWRRKSDLFTFEWPATKLVLLRPSTALNQIKILLLARESWVCTIVLED